MAQNNCDDYNDSFSKIEFHIEELTNKVEQLTSNVQDLSGQMSQLLAHHGLMLPRPDPDVTLVWNNGRVERSQIKYPNAPQNRHAW